MPISKERRVAVLLSGGLDSCVLTALLSESADTVFPVYVKQGLHWEQVERYWIDQFLESVRKDNIRPLKEISSPVDDVYDSHWSRTGKNIPDHRSQDREVYLPGRNLLLLTKTALFCALNAVPTIALGPLSANPFPDSTPEFFIRFQELASQALDFEIEIRTPFARLNKTDVIRLGKDLSLHLSFSCMSPVDRNHCGACNKCAERRRSFQQAGFVDQTIYHTLPKLV